MSDWLVPILVAILGGSGLSAWGAYVVAQGQIRKLSAEAAKIEKTALPEAESIAVETMKTALESVSSQVKSLHEEQKRCMTRIAGLEDARKKDRGQLRVWEIFGQDLHVRWDEHRVNEMAPRLPGFSRGPDMPGDGPWQE